MLHSESDHSSAPSPDTALESLTDLDWSNSAGRRSLSAQSARGSHASLAASPPPHAASPRTAPSPPSPQLSLVSSSRTSASTPRWQGRGPDTLTGPPNAISDAALQDERDAGAFSPDARLPHSPPVSPTSLTTRPVSLGSESTASTSIDGSADDLVDPLLKSFASLNVQDGSGDFKAQQASLPLCSLTGRATLITKSASNPYFVSTVSSVKRCHCTTLQKASQLEQNVVEGRSEAIRHMTAARNVLLRTRDGINQEQPSLVSDHSGAKESIEDLEKKLQKAQRDITTLHAEHLATPGLLEQMSLDVVSLQKQDVELALRLQQIGESQGSLGEATDRVAALVGELRAQNAAARRYTYPPRPSFTSETSADPPTSRSSTSSSRSQSFAEESPKHIEIAALQVEDASARRRGKLDPQSSVQLSGAAGSPSIGPGVLETAGLTSVAGGWLNTITLDVAVGSLAARILNGLHAVALLALIWSFQILSSVWPSVPKSTSRVLLSLLIVVLLLCLLCGLAVVFWSPSDEIDSPIWESLAPQAKA